MLNGLAPIIIFNFPVIPASLKSLISGIPVVGSSIASNVGLPIPIYLDESITGLFIESENRGIDVVNDTQAHTSGSAPTVDQKGLDNIVTVNFVADRENVLLSVLLALCDMAFAQIVSKNYGISYLSGSNVVFGGLLKGFNTQSTSDETKLRVTLEISKANNVASNQKSYLQVDPLRGATPLNPLGG